MFKTGVSRPEMTVTVFKWVLLKRCSDTQVEIWSTSVRSEMHSKLGVLLVSWKPESDPSKNASKHEMCHADDDTDLADTC